MWIVYFLFIQMKDELCCVLCYLFIIKVSFFVKVIDFQMFVYESYNFILFCVYWYKIKEFIYSWKIYLRIFQFILFVLYWKCWLGVVCVLIYLFVFFWFRKVERKGFVEWGLDVIGYLWCFVNYFLFVIYYSGYEVWQVNFVCVFDFKVRILE